MSTKNSLEIYIAAKLERIYKYSRPTLASGATPVEKGDVKNPYFAIECVSEGSLITTPNKYIKIENIVIGDEVLSGKGEKAFVKNVSKRRYSGELYEIKLCGITTPLIITGDHPVLYRFNYNHKERFLTADKICNEYINQTTWLKNCYLASPIPTRDRRLLKNKFISDRYDIKLNDKLVKLLRLYGETDKLNIICDKPPTKEIKDTGHSRRGMKFINNRSWHRIRSINKIHYDGFVYNLETTSEDYVCNNIIVHNCKIRNTKSFTFDAKVWKEIGYIAAREQKDPVYVIQNIEKDRIAIMDFEDWCNMVYELFELRKQHNA